MTLHISLAKVNDFDATSKVSFTRCPIICFSDLADIITQSAWSPILWRGDYRRAANFESCHLLVLDYDTGNPTLDEIIKLICRKNYRHIVATTKSHQRPKQGFACDRFRLIIHATGFANNPLQFKAQMVATKREFKGVDSSCLESARWYHPCREVKSMQDGRLYEAQKPPEIKEIKASIDKLKANDIELGKCGYVPDDVLAFAKTGALHGERRPSLFKFAARMTRLGMPRGKVFDMLMNAPFDKDDLKVEDVTRHIERGILYGKGYEGYSV